MKLKATHLLLLLLFIILLTINNNIVEGFSETDNNIYEIDNLIIPIGIVDNNNMEEVSLLNNATNKNETTTSDMFYTIFRSVYFNAIFSGTFASIIALVLTIVLEKAGGAVGGILGSIPTAIVPTAIGFFLDANRQFQDSKLSEQEQFDSKYHLLTQELYTVPISNFISCVYLTCLKFFPFVLHLIYKKIKEKNNNNSSSSGETKSERFIKWIDNLTETKAKVYKSLFVCFISLCVWFLIAIVWVSFLDFNKPINDRLLLSFSVIATALTLILGITICWKVKEQPETEKKKTAWYMYVCRTLFPFILISICVFLGSLKLTVVAGLLSGFPTIWTTTLITLWISQSEGIVMNAIGSMMLGSCSVSLFCLIIVPTGMYWNLIAGLFFSYDMAILFANVPAYFFIRWRREVAHQKKIEQMNKFRWDEHMPVRSKVKISLLNTNASSSVIGSDNLSSTNDAVSVQYIVEGYNEHVTSHELLSMEESERFSLDNETVLSSGSATKTKIGNVYKSSYF
ncbi:hypothetical protein ABK040_008031 [Willaertia magna]